MKMNGASGRRKWILWGLVIVAIGAGSAYFLNRNAKDQSGLRKAPDFQLENHEGKRVSLSTFADHIVVIHFWAAWCTPCIPEIPEVLSAATRLPRDADGRAIHWILVSVDESWEKAKKVLDVSKLPPHVTAVLDPESKWADAFGTYQYPETYALNRKHQITAKWIGAQDWSGDWGKSVLQGLDAQSRNLPIPQ